MVNALAAEGAGVILTGRSIDKLNRVFADLPDHGGQVHCMELDLADLEDIRQFGKHIREKSGKIDILFHCAALYGSNSWLDSSVDELDELYRTNVRGSFALTQLLLPFLIESQGDVVFINSSVSTFDGANVGQYAATKHALRGLANSLRAEVNQKGVRVLSVYPGRTATPLQEKIFQAEHKNYQPELLLQPEDIASMVIACLKLPATAEVTELHMRPKQKM